MCCTLRLPLYLTLVGVAAVALVTSGCADRRARRVKRAPAAVAAIEPAAPKQQAPAPPAQVVQEKREAKDSWEVRGWGENQEAAQQDALRRAVTKVKASLARQDPPIRWTPTPEEVRELFWVDQQAERRKDLDQEIQAPGGPIRAECWVIRIAVTPAALTEVARREAAFRAAERERERAAVSLGRMGVLARVLAAVVAGLLALLAYLRLDDWTKGYYSRRLAFGALGVLAVVGLGLLVCG